MRYDKYTIETTTEAEDIVVSILDDFGVQGALIEDRVPLTQEELDGMFVDIMPDFGEDDGKAYISFYLDAEQDHGTLLDDVRAALSDMKEYTDAGSCMITHTVTADEDYLNNWKQYFHQFYVDDILFIPSWEEVSAKDHEGLVIHVDPGTAFGTGKHETTQLCIRALRKYVTPGCKMLDVGTGSGILSILAFKFGAKSIIATDLDRCAGPATDENMAANKLADADFKLIIGNLIDDQSVQDEVGDGYDIVAANIQAEVLIPLMSKGCRCLKDGGIYIMSGILHEKEDAMRKACEENGLDIIETERFGEWTGMVARKIR